MGHAGGFLNNVRLYVRFYAVRNHYCPLHGNDTGKQVCKCEETRHQKRKGDFVVAHKEGTRESRLGALGAHGAPDSADATQADQPLTPQPHPHCAAAGPSLQRPPDLPRRPHLTPGQPRAQD